MTLYALILLVHSYLRWGVVALLVTVLVRSRRGWSRDLGWGPGDERSQRALLVAVDMQLVLGLLMYLWLSPIVRAFMSDPRHAVKEATLRFFAIEHILGMVVGVVVLHVGRVRSRRAATQRLRHRRVWVSTLVATLIMVGSIPWPPLKYARPLLRDGSVLTAARATAPPRCPPSFQVRCVSCHGASGRGDGPAAYSLHPRPRDFTDRRWQATRTATELAAVIRDGGAAHGLSVSMPSHRELSPTTIDTLVGCVRGFGAPF
ncbi:MAG: cytochrome c [Deltaproteobacteria bacterium]|nr:cytochrome c [Deltaproteobacteria bacterium]